MLDCLGQAATPDQGWPSLRESASLLAGALRARARGRVGSSSLGGLWASGLRVGAFLGLGIQMALCVQRWGYDWSHQAVFLTDEPQSQLMNPVWFAALLASLPLGRRVRSGAAWLTAGAALAAFLYSALLKGGLIGGFGSNPSKWILHTLDTLPVAAGLLVPAALVVRFRSGLANHNHWTLPVALTGPVLVAVCVVAAGPAAIDAIQMAPYVALVVGAVLLSRFDPRLAIASTVAILPLALLELGQVLHSGPPGRLSLTDLQLSDVMTSAVPLMLLAIVALNGSRAWERVNAS